MQNFQHLLRKVFCRTSSKKLDNAYVYFSIYIDV